MSSCAPLWAAKVKRRRRGDKRHRYNAGLHKSGWRKTLPLSYDVWRLWDYLYLFHTDGTSKLVLVRLWIDWAIAISDQLEPANGGVPNRTLNDVGRSVTVCVALIFQVAESSFVLVTVVTDDSDDVDTALLWSSDDTRFVSNYTDRTDKANTPHQRSASKLQRKFTVVHFWIRLNLFESSLKGNWYHILTRFLIYLFSTRALRV